MTELLRILHLEDSLADADLIAHQLKKAGLDFVLTRVETRNQFLEKLEAFKPEIILADCKLTDFDGLQALITAREHYPLTPFIFVAGIMEEDVAIETLKNGADDYIYKDRMNRLPSAVRQALDKKEVLKKHRLAEQALLASEAKFRNIFESSADAMLLVDDDCFIDCNPTAISMFACKSRDDLMEQKLAIISASKLSDGENNLSMFTNYFTNALQEGVQHFEWVTCRLDGSEFFADILLTPLEIDNKKVVHITVRDITEQKKQQIRIQRLTNLYATLSQTNESITRCSNEAELFPQICQFAVQNGGMKMAWIGLVDNNSQLLKSVASYGDGTGYLEHIKISVDVNDPYSHGPSGLCFRENRPLWCQDFQHDPMTKLWHERSQQYGWGSSASLPLQRKGVTVGILTLYASTIDAFDEEARRLLTEMASDVSFAMDNFAHEATAGRLK